MSCYEEPLLSPDQLLELESACDEFESLLASGQTVEIESLVNKASVEIRQVLRLELVSILRQATDDNSGQTVESGLQTESPDEFVLQTGRVSSFAPATPAVDTKPNPALDTRPDPSRRGERETGAAKETPPAATETFGRFQLQSIVGQGGSGVVWRAFDSNLNRWVALKIAHTHSVTDSKRFVREAQAVARLKHSNVIPVYDAGELDGKCFLVSEFCDGGSLSSLLKEGEISIGRVVEIVAAITDAIAHSHQNRIIHRDIKPHNVMIGKDGVPLLTDFGLAKNLVHDRTLTFDGELLGTPAYMAPEQAEADGQRCDERTDIYSIGVVLFQLLCGTVPFAGSFERVIFQVVNTPPPAPRSINPCVPAELEAICLKCLEKFPSNRFQSALELRDELSRFSSGQPVRTRQPTVLGRYFRWLRNEPKLAWTATACVGLLFCIAIGATVAASLLGSAWRRERAHVAMTEESLHLATAAQLEANEARERAEKAESIAKQQAQANQQESDFLTGVFAPMDLMGVNQMSAAGSNGSKPMTAAAIEEAIVKANQLLSDAPIVQSRIKGMLANAWRSRGELEKARTLLLESTRLLEENRQVANQDLSVDLAMNELYWAYLFHHNEDFQKSDSRYRNAIGLFKKRVSLHPDNAIGRLQLAQAEFGLGASLLKQKRNVAAKPLLQHVLQTRRELLPAGDSLLLATELAYLQCDPENSLKELPAALQSADKDTAQKAMTLYWSMTSNRKRGDFSKATQQYETLIELIRENVGEDNWLYLIAVGDFAGLQWEAGKYQAAESNVMLAIERSRNFSSGHPKRMKAMMLLSFELILAERFEDAERVLNEVADSESSKWNDSTGLHSNLAICLLNDDWSEDRNASLAKALRHSEAALRKTTGRCTAAETAWYSFNHANVLKASGKDLEAATLREQSVKTAQQIISDSKLPEHSTWSKRVGIVLADAGHHESAEIAFRHAVVWAEREYFAKHPRVAGVKTWLAETLIDQGRFLEAVDLLAQVLQVQQKSLSADDKRSLTSKRLMSEASSKAEH